jgi:hypothetical protein
MFSNSQTAVDLSNGFMRTTPAAPSAVRGPDKLRKPVRNRVVPFLGGLSAEIESSERGPEPRQSRPLTNHAKQRSRYRPCCANEPSRRNRRALAPDICRRRCGKASKDESRPDVHSMLARKNADPFE